MSKCPKCNAEVPEGSSFCEECGADIPQVKVCPSCQKEVSITAKFCRYCKYDFRVQAPPTLTAPMLNAELGKNVFISYARKDKGIVIPIVDRLQNALGVKFWMDVNGIESGDQFEKVIINAINNSAIIIFFHSQNSLQSDWVEREIKYAEKQRKKIIPILIDSSDLEGWFSFHFSSIDFIDSKNEDHLAKLTSNLKEWLGISKESGNKTEAPNLQIEQKSIAKNDNTIIVAQDGSGDSKTIVGAIKKAKKGATIVVKPGHYVENIKINKGVVICGEKGESGYPEISCKNNDNEESICVEITSSNATLKNFSIANIETNDNVGVGIGIIDCSPTIENCLIQKC